MMRTWAIPRMVKEMSRMQFIYISHNKIAMEMADQLMVTMHEPGVWELVSVDLEKAAEMIAS